MKEAFFRFMELLGFVPEREASRALRLAVEDARKVCTAKPHEEIAVELVKHGDLIYRTCLCGEVYDGEISKNRLWWADHKARKVAELWSM